MNKVMKGIISVVMSFAMVICLAPAWAGAEEMSAGEDEIAPASITIGQQYSIMDSRGEITAQFIEPSKVLIQYKNKTETARYVEMDVSTPNKSFKTRTFVIGKKGTHSELYNINYNVGRVTIVVYPHTSTNPSSGYIDALRGILQ